MKRNTNKEFQPSRRKILSSKSPKENKLKKLKRQNNKNVPNVWALGYSLNINSAASWVA